MLKKIFAALIFFLSLSYVGPVFALTPPAPSPTTSCSTAVTAFSAFKRCATGSGMDFLEASFKCASFAETQKISRGYCVNYYDLYQSAADSCKNVCVTPSASVPVTSSTAPSAPPACRAQELATYKFDGACPVMVDNKPQYNFIDYKCGDETTYRRMGSATSCQWGSSLIDGAQFYCRKNSCTSTPTPTPKPTIAPTPPPTADPSTSISCTPVIYKIPSGSKVTPYNLTSFVSATTELNYTNIKANPGDMYLHGIKIKNTSNKSISTAGIPFVQIAKPTITDRTREFDKQYTWSNGCTIDQNDVMTCPVEHFSIPVGGYVVPKQSLFATYVATNPSQYMNLTSGYHMSIKSSQSSYIIKNCGQEFITLSLPSPVPVATSIATPAPRFCEASCYFSKWSKKSRMSCIDLCRETQ